MYKRQELCWDFFVGGDFVLSIFRMEEQWYNLNNLIEEGGTHMIERTYLAIDLKSFYASVECMERGLDPMTTNLVVAEDVYKRQAWLSSARVVRCWVKSRNERNPYR